MRWLAILDNGYRYEGPFALLEKKRVHAIEVYWDAVEPDRSPRAILKPEDRRLVIRNRVNWAPSLGVKLEMLLVAFEPWDISVRDRDTYGFLFADGQRLREFIGYRNGDRRAPVLEVSDL
jgi:hypothetical protein